MTTVEDLENEILVDIVADFRTRNLPADSLNEEYVGLTLYHLHEKYCTNGLYTKVDFDLAMKELESKEFIKTGPMAFYDNPPNSSLIVIAMYSKREYTHLTEKGYRAAQHLPPRFRRN